MKKLFALITLSLLITSAGFAQSQKFGHIDFQKLLSEMPSRQKAEQEYQKEANSIRSELETMQVEYNNKYQNFIDQRDTLSDFVQQTRMEEIQNLEQRINQYQRTAQQRLRQTQQEIMQPVMDKANKAIKAVMQREGYIYVVRKGNVFVNEDISVNVLPMVKEELGIAE